MYGSRSHTEVTHQRVVANWRVSRVQNPEIRQMAEQMASDPSFQAITQQLAGMGLAPGAPGMPPVPGTAAAAQPADSSASSTTAERALPAAATPAAAAAGAGAGAAASPAGGMPGPGAGGMPVDPERYMKVCVCVFECRRRSCRCISLPPWFMLPTVHNCAVSA